MRFLPLLHDERHVVVSSSVQLSIQRNHDNEDNYALSRVYNRWTECINMKYVPYLAKNSLTKPRTSTKMFLTHI